MSYTKKQFQLTYFITKSRSVFIISLEEIIDIRNQIWKTFFFRCWENSIKSIIPQNSDQPYVGW